MDKKETIEAIANFIDFNSIDIANLYRTQPEIGNAFTTVLNALSKEYGSGEEFDTQLDALTKIAVEEPKQERAAQDIYSLNVGDKVYVPTFKRGQQITPGMSNVVDRARKKFQPYLFVTEIDGKFITLNNEAAYTGDYFSLSDLVPYPGNYQIGDMIKNTMTKDSFFRVEAYTKAGNSEKVDVILTPIVDGKELTKTSMDALTLRGLVERGTLKFGEEEAEQESSSQEKQIDPDDFNSLIGFTVQQLTARKYEEYKVLGIKKINPTTIKYNVETKDKRILDLNIPKTMVSKLLRGKETNGVRVLELFSLTKDEKQRRIKNLEPESTPKPVTATPTTSTGQTQYTKGAFRLNIDTLPEIVDYYADIDRNKGDRPAPTQSAGTLYKQYSTSQNRQSILNTLFKGNDGNWYKLAERTNKWLWVKAKPEDISKYTTSANKDYGTMSNPELIKLRDEINEAMALLDSTDEEYQELNQELNKLNKYIK